MYCKNCGRQLKEGMRFCDRCGQSVRKGTQGGQMTKRQEIEELKAERLNRKRRLEEKEAHQNRVRKNKKKGGNAFIFVIVMILILAASFIIGYKIFEPEQTNQQETTQTSTSKQSTSNTDINSQTTSAPSATPKPSSAGSGNYSEFKVGNYTCPYPSSFKTGTTSGNQKIMLTDADGEAKMSISQEYTSDEPKDLFKEYSNEIGGKIDQNLSKATNDQYTITSKTNSVLRHRKCIVKNGIAVYYDFEYKLYSSSTQKYEEYIKYIDENFN